jgi:hypothetical protein
LKRPGAFGGGLLNERGQPTACLSGAFANLLLLAALIGGFCRRPTCHARAGAAVGAGLISVLALLTGANRLCLPRCGLWLDRCCAGHRERANVIVGRQSAGFADEVSRRRSWKELLWWLAEVRDCRENQQSGRFVNSARWSAMDGFVRFGRWVRGGFLVLCVLVVTNLVVVVAPDSVRREAMTSGRLYQSVATSVVTVALALAVLRLYRTHWGFLLLLLLLGMSFGTYYSAGLDGAIGLGVPLGLVLTAFYVGLYFILVRETGQQTCKVIDLWVRLGGLPSLWVSCNFCSQGFMRGSLWT